MIRNISPIAWQTNRCQLFFANLDILAFFCYTGPDLNN